MFRTEIPLIPNPRQLARTARVLTLGSCFADSIGGRLAAHKVPTLINPFGTVFNPLSAALLLRAAAGEPVDWSQHLVEARGRWQSYDLHGSVGADSAEALLARIQELVRQTAEFVRAADVLALTLGTAWVYRLRETGELVSNCHKLPAALFEKELLTAEEVVGQLAEAHALLRRFNPQLRLVLTVSPVRHLRDTLPLSSVSKSVLRLASHYLSELLPDASYFPAYELLTDDLRDYRFYATDMLHPSAAAEDYIWERFARTYFDADFGRFRKEWDGIQLALAHRPLYAGAPEHRQFLESTLEKLRRLAGQKVEVRVEIRDVERRLLSLPPPPRPKPTTAFQDDGEERIDIGQPAPDELVSEQGLTPTAPLSEQPDAAMPPADVSAAAEAPATSHARGRGRPNRRGHSKDRTEANQILAEAQVPPTELLPAMTSVAPPVPAKPSYTDYLISSAPELMTFAPQREAAAPAATTPEEPVAVAAVGALPAEPGSEPVKKKKRRSRGGAKRTARKNAARLAAEQSPELLAETDRPRPIEMPEDSATSPIIDAPVLAPDDSSDSLAPESTMLPTSDTISDTTDSQAPVVDAPTDVPASSPEPDAATPLMTPSKTPKKRGTGPEVKKSKVITKSVPVKRGSQRGPVPRKKTADATAPPVSVAEPAHPAEEAAVANQAGPADSTTIPTPPAAPKAGRPAAAKRPPAPKLAKPKAPLTKSAKPAPKATSRPRKAPADVAPANPADQPTAAEPPVAAEPATAAPRRRGRPPGTRRRPSDEPAAS